MKKKKGDTKLNIDMLKMILKMTQEELKAFLAVHLQKFYSEDDIHVEGQYILVDGSIPVGLVSHMDIVRSKPPTVLLMDSENRYITSIDNVLGADDRAGVIAILTLLERGYRPTIIFTEDEEIGCVGARAMCKEYESIPVKYLVEIDRRGDDVVFYQNGNESWIEYVKKFRDKVGSGSCSDISHLSPTFGISSCNMGSGYFHEHTSEEYLDTNILNDTIDVVAKMLDDCANVEVFEYVVKTYTSSTYRGAYAGAYSNYYSGYYGYEDDYGITYKDEKDLQKNNASEDKGKVYYNGKWMTFKEYSDSF